MLVSDAHLQGGAANTPDAFRGYLNEGGLYAERIGAHLPGFPDTTWSSGTPLTGGGVSGAGINFYRTSFNLVRVSQPTTAKFSTHHDQPRIFPMTLTYPSDSPSPRVR